MKYQGDIFTCPATIIIEDIDDVEYFNKIISECLVITESIDRKFNHYNKDSLISKISQGELQIVGTDNEIDFILTECERLQKISPRFFNYKDGTKYDLLSIVKGYAIAKISEHLQELGHQNFIVEIGGDIQTSGSPSHKDKWTIGIRCPWLPSHTLGSIYANNIGIATSGNYARTGHIDISQSDLLSVTVIAADAYIADSYSTQLFAGGSMHIKEVANLLPVSIIYITKDKQIYSIIKKEHEKHFDIHW